MLRNNVIKFKFNTFLTFHIFYKFVNFTDVRSSSSNPEMPINGIERYEPIRKMRAVQVNFKFFFNL